MGNQGRLGSVDLCVKDFGVFLCVCASAHICSSKSKSQLLSWSVYCLKSKVIQSAAWLMNWLEKSTANYPDLSLIQHSAGQSRAWSLPANIHLGLLLAFTPSVLGVLTVQKPRLPLHGDVAVWLPGWEMRPAGSLGVKTSHWFSDVSEGQISFLLLRFIRRLIKGDRSMEGDSTFTSNRENGKKRDEGLYAVWNESSDALVTWKAKLCWGFIKAERIVEHLHHRVGTCEVDLCQLGWM